MIRRIRGEGGEGPAPGYPVAARAGSFLFLSGHIGWTQAGGLVRGFAEAAGAAEAFAAGDPLMIDLLEEPVLAQSWVAYEQMSRLLEKESSSLADLLRAHIYQRDKRFWPVFERVRIHYEPRPAPSSGIGVSRLAQDAWIGLDGIALVPGTDPATPGREVLQVPGMLRSSSYYSQAVGAGPYIFLAGQMPVETGSGRFIRGYADVPEEGRFLATGRSHSDTRNGPIAAQTWFEYDHVRRVLEALGASMADVLNLTVYLQDIRDLPTFYRVHQRFFPQAGPALTVTEFAEVGHGGTLVEIEVTALLPGRGLSRRAFSPPRLARGAGHRSAAVAGGPLLFLSGQVACTGERVVRGPADLSLEGRRVAERLGTGTARAAEVAAQAWQIFANLQEVLAEAGLGFQDLVKTTVYLRDLDDFPVYDRVREAFAPGEPPALAYVQVPKVGPWEGCLICVEAIAWGRGR